MNKKELKWSRLHLLHFGLHGPGDQFWNLTPVDRKANSRMYRIEKQAIKELEDSKGRKALVYETKVKYRTKKGEEDFPETISMRVWEYNPGESENKGKLLFKDPDISSEPPRSN